jgi:hypothetical protein
MASKRWALIVSVPVLAGCATRDSVITSVTDPATTTDVAPVTVTTTEPSTITTLPASVDVPTSTSTTEACAGYDAMVYGGDILFAPGTKLGDFDEGLVSPVLAEATISYADLALTVDCVPTDMRIWGGESLIEHCVDCDESVVPELLHIVMTSTTDGDTGEFVDHVWAVFNRWDESRALGDALAFRLIDGGEGSDGVAPTEELPRACWSTAYEAPVVFTTDAREVDVEIVRAWVYRDAGDGATWHPADSAVVAPPRDPPTCTRSDGSSVICDC